MVDNGEKTCVIAIEDWQMQCCGTTFTVGEKVEWIVHELGKPSEVTGRMVEYYYEQHSSDWQKLFRAVGVVTEIKALYCSYEQRPNEYGNKQGFVRYPIYEKAVDVDTAYGCADSDGWYEDIDGLEFIEYEVTLRDCAIRPAKESEVTFS